MSRKHRKEDNATIAEVIMFEVTVRGEKTYFKTRQEALAYARNHIEQEIYKGRKAWPAIRS